MILVDSSVWIDYFNGKQTAETDALDRLMDTGTLLVGDLILAEVLLGFVLKQMPCALNHLEFFESLLIKLPGVLGGATDTPARHYDLGIVSWLILNFAGQPYRHL